MKDVIIRSDKAPFEEIPPLSGWELTPLNPLSGQPVRHFASIAEVIAYAHYESPARKQLINHLAQQYRLVILDASALGDLALQIVESTLDILVEEGALAPEVRERIQFEMASILGEPTEPSASWDFGDMADDMFPNCTGDSETCPDCGPGNAQDIGYDPGWPSPLNIQPDSPFETEAPEGQRGFFRRLK